MALQSRVAFFFFGLTLSLEKGTSTSVIEKNLTTAADILSTETAKFIKNPSEIFENSTDGAAAELHSIIPAMGNFRDGNQDENSSSRNTAKKRIETQFEELPTPLSQKSADEAKGYTRDDGTYIVEDSAEMPCVLAYFKAKITVYYPTNRAQEKYKNTVVYPPDDVAVSGKCDRDSLIAVLSLTWEQGVFSLRFAYDDITDSWYVDRFSFAFNSSMSAYKGVDKVEKVILKSEEKKRFWTTSHARSFRCLLLHDVTLSDDNDMYSGTIHFDEARVQALTKSKTFKTPKHCIHRVHRDEMVPVIVGAALTSLTLLIVLAYGLFRYFKVKKFQYGTME